MQSRRYFFVSVDADLCEDAVCCKSPNKLPELYSADIFVKMIQNDRTWHENMSEHGH